MVPARPLEIISARSRFVSFYGEATASHSTQTAVALAVDLQNLLTNKKYKTNKDTGRRIYLFIRYVNDIIYVDNIIYFRLQFNIKRLFNHSRPPCPKRAASAHKAVQ